MLPSKGFFASYICPFYEQESCERPYCHFHHRKKTKQSEIRRGYKTSHSIQANHTKAFDEFREIENNFVKTYGRVDYPTINKTTGNILSYTPTPIALLKKRNTLGSYNNKLDIDEEILIKKQKTQTCSGPGSSGDSVFPVQNILKTGDIVIGSKNAIEYQSVSNDNAEENLNEDRNYIGMSPEKTLTDRVELDSLYDEGESFNNHEKRCDALKNDHQLSICNPISKIDLNHSKKPNQTNLNLAGGEFKTETNTSRIHCHFTKTDNSYSDTSKNTFPLGPHGESFMNNILEGKNTSYLRYSVDENDTKENSFAYGNDDFLSKKVCNLDESKCTITANEDLSSNVESINTPKETYASIVKQDKSFSYDNKNKSKNLFSLETLGKVNSSRILTEANFMNETNGVMNNASKKSGKKTKSNKEILIEGSNKDLNSSCKYKALPNKLLDEKSSKKTVLNEKVPDHETQSSIIQSINVKQRISLSDTIEKKKSAIEAAKVKPRCSPSQVLLERWKTVGSSNKKSNERTENKMRVAYVPNVAALLAERQRITNSLTKSTQVKENVSNSSNKFKGISLLKKDLLVEFVDNSKVTIIKRQVFLNKAFENYSKLFSYDIARTKAVDAEKEICSTSKSQATYYNKFAQFFLRLKKETTTKNDAQKTSSESTPSMETGEANRLLLYYDLLKYIMSDLEDLEDKGIPVPHTEKSGYAKMKKIYGVSSYNKDKSICINCLKEFEVDSAGFSIERNNCKFHSGRKFKQKRKYGIEKVWSCCNGDEEREGCMENELHVRDMVDYDNIPGFKQVREPTVSFEEACQIYALDCEMCYTTEGSELTRCTVVDSNLKVVYDKLCSPDLPIIDYCTKFSGISEGDLDEVSTKLADIQDDLLNLFTTETILIGHGIGNDLKAVKLLHRSIIDTNVVYGNCRKHKLSDLTRDILHRQIQISSNGHDSSEDAIAAMELMLRKVKEDRKKAKKVGPAQIN